MKDKKIFELIESEQKLIIKKKKLEQTVENLISKNKHQDNQLTDTSENNQQLIKKIEEMDKNFKELS